MAANKTELKNIIIRFKTSDSEKILQTLDKIKEKSEQISKLGANRSETLNSTIDLAAGNVKATQKVVQNRDLESYGRVQLEQLEKVVSKTYKSFKTTFTTLNKFVQDLTLAATNTAQLLESTQSQLLRLQQDRANALTGSFTNREFGKGLQRSVNETDLAKNKSYKTVMSGNAGNIRPWTTLQGTLTTALNNQAKEATLTERQRSAYERLLELVTARIQKYHELGNEINKVTAQIQKLEIEQSETSQALGAAEELQSIAAQAQEEIQTKRDMVNATEEETEALNRNQDVRQEAINTSQQLSAYEDELQHKRLQEQYTLDKVINRYLSTVAIYHVMIRLTRQLVTQIGQLDTVFTNIAVVSNYSTKEVWQLYDSLQAIAIKVGSTTKEIATIADEYYRQGKSTSEVIKLTEAAAISASVANINMRDSVDYLTSALNGYKLSANDALVVSDKFAQLSAQSATGYEELAIALSKVAAQAANSGVEMDNLLGFIAVALETTREAPENIGTAFKTIFARMSEIKEFGKTLDDGIDANRVEKALDTIGVRLFNKITGQMRDLDDVLIEVGQRWQNLTQNQRAYLATALAGTRQQTRLISIFQDFDRTMELAEISANSLGSTLAQQGEKVNSIEYAIANFSTQWEKVLKTYSNTGLIVGVIDSVSTAMSLLNNDTVKFMANLLSMLVIFKALEKAHAFGAMAQGIALVTNQGKNFLTILKEIVKAFSLFRVNNAAKSLNEVGTALTTNIKEVDVLKEKFSALGKFLAANAWVVGILALTTAIVATINANKQLIKDLTTLNSRLFDIKNKTKNYQQLAKEFVELDAKVVKTAEDLDRLKSIAEQLNEENVVVDIDMNFDQSAFDKLMDNIKAQEAQALSETLSKSLSAAAGDFDEAYKKADTTTKEAFTTGIAIRILDGVHNYQSVDEYTQAMARKVAKTALEAEVDLEYKSYTDIDGNEINDPTSLENIKQYYQELVNLQVQLRNLSVEEQTKLIASYVENLQNTNIPVETYNDLMRVVGALNPVYASLAEYAERFANGNVLQILSDVVAAGSDLEQFVSLQEVLNTFAPEDTVDRLALLNGAMEILSGVSGELGIALPSLLSFFEEMGLTTEQASDALINLYEKINGLDKLTLPNVTESIKGLQTRFKDLNSSITDGNINYKLLEELITEYPQYADSILDSVENRKEIEGDLYNSIIEGERAALIAKIQSMKQENALQQAQLQAKIDYLNTEASQAYNSTRNYRQAINSVLTESYTYELKDFQAAMQEKLNLQQQYGNKAVAMAAEIGNATREAEKTGSGKNITSASLVTNIPSWQKANQEAYAEYIQLAKDSAANYQKQLDSLKNTARLYDVAIDDAATSTLEASDASKKAAGAAKEYEAQLNKVYIAQQKLSMLTEKGDLADKMLNLFEGRDGKAWQQMAKAKVKLLEAQNQAYTDLVAAQKEQQNILTNNLSPAVRDSFMLIGDRMLPVMEKYNKLSLDDKKAADEFAKSFNGLSSEIHSNTLALIDNQNALKELEEKRRDMLIETQKILIEAIKNEEKKIYEERKKGLEKEKEILDERKKMYEEAFKEQDYESEVEKLNQKRRKLENDIAKLEGATDAKSVIKRQELLQQLAELNEEYNNKTTEYSRDALLAQMDDEADKVDQEQELLEKQYEERINNYEWLQQRLNEITARGVEGMLAYLRQWHDDYINGTTAMREKVEEQWRFLFEAVYADVDGIQTQASWAVNAIMAVINSLNQMTQAAWAAAKAFQDATKAKHTYNSTPVKETTQRFVNEGGNVVSAHTKAGAEYLAKYGFSQGGYVDYTGLAMVHGSPASPEAFLNAEDTRNFEELKESLRQSRAGVTNSSVLIEKIDIHTNELNNAQDFAAAGRSLAESFHQAYTERGITKNIKR